MRRHIHYEAAFEDYLRCRGLPYVAVDETRRALFGRVRVKSFDFLVYQTSGPNWLVDIKGRKFPYDTQGNHRRWENWVGDEDLDGLREWEGVFGDGFRAVLLFAYLMTGPPEKWPFQSLHTFRDRSYAFLAVTLADYKASCVQRSPSWRTSTLPTGTFRSLASSF